MSPEKGRSNGSLKVKLLVGIIIVLLVFLALWFGMHLIENHLKGEESQYGDTGDWGKDKSEGEDLEDGDEQVLIFGDNDLVYTDDIRTYLLIGTDDTGHDNVTANRGEMADFVMLMIINRTKDSYGFIQLNRDTMMDVPILDENGEFIGTYNEQLCIAHWYGRTPEERNENTVYAVSQLLGGLEINGYYSINMDDIGALNDAIGGVVVTIDGDLTGVDPEFEDGKDVLLKGDQAEKYLRARMGVGEGTNEERMDRQLTYMQAAYGRLINQIRENPDYINDVYSEVEDKVLTDRPIKEFSEFAAYIGKVENLGFLRFDGEVKTGDTLDDGIEHAEFYPDQDSMIRTIGKLITLKQAAPDTEDEEPEEG